MNNKLLSSLRRKMQRIAINYIVKTNKESNYVKHFISEFNSNDSWSEMFKADIIELLSVLSIQGDSGLSIGYKRHLFSKASNFEILSPLKFTDDEWIETSFSGYQNCRLSSVFKEDNGEIHDIDAIRLKKIKRYEMSERKLNDDVSSALYHGSCILYNADDNSYHIYKDLIINKDTYEGKNYFTLPCIELYDATDKHNDFFCNVGILQSIPKSFYGDYKLVIDERKEKTYEKELTYCRENNIAKMLNDF